MKNMGPRVNLIPLTRRIKRRPCISQESQGASSGETTGHPNVLQ